MWSVQFEAKAKGKSPGLFRKEAKAPSVQNTLDSVLVPILARLPF